MAIEKESLQSESLIRRARAGEAEAVGVLCERIRPGLTAFIQRRMSTQAGRWTTADDITQGVLIEMVRQLPSLPEAATEEDVWKRVHRTAGFRVTDALRRHRVHFGESVCPSMLGEPGGNTPSTGPVTRADDRRWLEALIARLPPKYADVVRLCALEGLSSDEAARELGLRNVTVRKRYETARKALNRKSSGQHDG